MSFEEFGEFLYEEDKDTSEQLNNEISPREKEKLLIDSINLNLKTFKLFKRYGNNSQLFESIIHRLSRTITSDSIEYRESRMNFSKGNNFVDILLRNEEDEEIEDFGGHTNLILRNNKNEITEFMELTFNGYFSIGFSWYTLRPMGKDTKRAIGVSICVDDLIDEVISPAPTINFESFMFYTKKDKIYPSIDRDRSWQPLNLYTGKPMSFYDPQLYKLKWIMSEVYNPDVKVKDIEIYTNNLKNLENLFKVLTIGEDPRKAPYLTNLYKSLID